MTSIADQIQEKIVKGEMPQPIPRWMVKVKHAALWGLFVSFVLVGAASSGVAVWFMTDPGGLLDEYKNGEALSQILDALPLFWITLSIILAVGAIAVFIHAPRAYRYKRAVITGIIVLAFIACGGAISATGLSDKIEQTAAYMPGYRFIQKPRIDHFIQIQQNRIIGRIQTTANGQLIVQDPNGIIWKVDTLKCDPRHVEMAEPGRCVNIIGIPSTTLEVFEAKKLLPCPRGIRLQHVQMYLNEQVKEPPR